MDRIRTLVCDDEPMARHGVSALLARDPEIEVVGEAADGDEAITLIERLAPDLLMLDVQMPAGDGFVILDSLAQRRGACLPLVVFLTAYDEYAVRAFDARAVDYLLKPFSDARFDEATRRAKEAVRRRHPTSPDGAPVRRFRERIPVRVGATIRFVATDEIDWIEADDYYARLHTGGRTHLIREPMRDLERSLDPTRFVRVHRSVIVNVGRVRRLRAAERMRYVVLEDGTPLRVSRSRRVALEAALGLRAAPKG